MSITRVSLDSAGNQANDFSGSPSISADGRFVGFSSSATNLVPGDTNNSNDIFLRDLSTNTTIGISVDSAGNPGNGSSFSHSISANGRLVAFSSSSSNLVPGDTNNSSDIFLRDLSANTTTRISVDSAGNPGNGHSFGHSISGNGRFVAFSSSATNLVPGDTNNSSDIFLRDLLTNTTTCISVDSAGSPGGRSGVPSISTDGRFVAFSSDATNLVSGDTNNSSDIFLRDLLTNTTTRISVDSAGNQAMGNSRANASSISADGRLVTFVSDATNLVPGTTNDTSDIFVRDLSKNTTTRASVSEAGRPGNDFSIDSSISGDGRFVAFSSNAINLVAGDTNKFTDIFVVDLTNIPSNINNLPNITGENLIGTPGVDWLRGFDGDDTLTGRQGNDLLLGRLGNDILNGGKGSDNLSGGNGNDILNGGNGSDNLDGGAGNDTLTGGADNDSFLIGPGWGIDTISDFTNGQDTISLISLSSFEQLSISGGTNGTLIKVASSGEVLAFLTGVDPNLLGPEDFIIVPTAIPVGLLAEI
jgi:Ca2+-binding RTX toxin-like protein